MQFNYGSNGKPRLAETFGPGALKFSITSSQGLALYGFICNREIGVDVECIRDIPEMDQIAKRILSPREAQIYQALPKPLKREVFFACWTRKEAFVKATGDSLSRALDKFELTADPREPTASLEISRDRRTTPGWSIQNIKPNERFIAAIAAQQDDWKVHCRQWAYSM